MNAINKLKTEPRLIIAIIAIITFFLPWISAEVTSDYTDVPITAEAGSSALAMLNQSGLMIILLLIPIGLIIFELTDIIKIKARKGLVYLGVSILSILCHFYFVWLIAQSQVEAQMGDEFSFEVSIHRLYGFWISFAAYVAIIIVTLIKDYYLTLNKAGVESVLGGIKRDLSATDLRRGGKVSVNLSGPTSLTDKEGLHNNQMMCSSCGTRVTAGKQFCENCGAKLVVPEHKARCCQGCGYELSEDHQFCPKCGVEYVEPEPQELKCAQCGYALSEDHQFCPKCGTAVKTAGAKETV